MVKNSATHRQASPAGCPHQTAVPFTRPYVPKPGATFITAVAASLTAAGNRNNSTGAMNNVGSNGNYWSRTRYDNTNAYNLNFNSSNVNPANNNNRTNGFTIRCVPGFLQGDCQ